MNDGVRDIAYCKCGSIDMQGGRRMCTKGGDVTCYIKSDKCHRVEASGGERGPGCEHYKTWEM